MIQGVDVILYEKRRVGTDDFGVPVYTETPVRIENVLVCPASSDDIQLSTQIYGKRAAYTLAVPKGDLHKWEDSKVEFFGRIWRTFGWMTKGIEENIPLAWNGKIQVELYG